MDQAQAMGAPAIFEYKGKRYLVAQRNIDHESMFCQWAKAEAFQEIERLKHLMEPALYKMHVDGFRHDIGMKLYDWGMPFITVAAMSEAGSKYLALLALAQHDVNVTPAFIDEIAKDADAWSRLCNVMADLNDPNRQRQTQGA